MTDADYHDFCIEISAQKVDFCSEKEIDKQVLIMVARGNICIKKTVSRWKAKDIKPSMASDIWSHSEVSLMGTMLYYIEVHWTGLHAMLIGTTGFAANVALGRTFAGRLSWICNLPGGSLRPFMPQYPIRAAKITGHGMVYLVVTALDPLLNLQ